MKSEVTTTRDRCFPSTSGTFANTGHKPGQGTSSTKARPQHDTDHSLLTTDVVK